jgi:hypothetical protein
MSRNPLGWDYPPGAEHHPDAPWNQIEEHPGCCLDCEYLRYDADGDYAWCIEGEMEIERSINDVPSNCPLDRRSEVEAREDYLADMADKKKKR